MYLLRQELPRHCHFRRRTDVDRRPLINRRHLQGQNIFFAVRGPAAGLLHNEGHRLKFKQQPQLPLGRFLQCRIREYAAPLDDHLVDVGNKPTAVAQLVAVCLQLIDKLQMASVQSLRRPPGEKIDPFSLSRIFSSDRTYSPSRSSTNSCAPFPAE